MRVKVWGARGSVPSPGPETSRYGGNTACVQVTLSDGTTLVLDAGSGIRGLGLAMADDGPRLNILLTHLHMDHILGLMFFAPLFRQSAEIAIWGPESPSEPLLDRIARYISAPLSPLEVGELPCSLSFRDASQSEWRIGPATVRAAAVNHRGPTLGYRISEGGSSLCYLPDHEPRPGSDIAKDPPERISGLELAHRATFLVHDCQYTDEEYQAHEGWGHSSLSDALAFARRSEAERLLLFHHDPMHDDAFLDRLHATATARWAELGGPPGAVELAAEHAELEVGESTGSSLGRP
jgi:phosphoribosyl 1,2-cyclic phosphodiesterase